MSNQKMRDIILASFTQKLALDLSGNGRGYARPSEFAVDLISKPKTASGNLFESAMTRIHRAAEDVMDPAPGPISSMARAGKRSLEDLAKSDAAQKAKDTLTQLMKRFGGK